MKESYGEMMARQQKEYDEFFKNSRAFYAYNDKQFAEGMKQIGLDADNPEDCAQMIRYYCGGIYMVESEVEKFDAFFARQNAEKERAIRNDKTGSGFIKDMFLTVMFDVEFAYSGDYENVIDYAGLDVERVSRSKRLLNGLQLAREECLRACDI